MLFPVLLLCDENGEYIDFTENDIVTVLERAHDEDIHYFSPTEDEQQIYRQIYGQLTAEMTARYEKSVEQTKRYNEQKLLNWAAIQKDQLKTQIQLLRFQVETILAEEVMAKDSLLKEDILKNAADKKKQLDKLEREQVRKEAHFDEEAQNGIVTFNKSLEITPLLLVNIILKF